MGFSTDLAELYLLLLSVIIFFVITVIRGGRLLLQSIINKKVSLTEAKVNEILLQIERERQDLQLRRENMIRTERLEKYFLESQEYLTKLAQVISYIERLVDHKAAVEEENIRLKITIKQLNTQVYELDSKINRLKNLIRKLAQQLNESKKENLEMRSYVSGVKTALQELKIKNGGIEDNGIPNK